MTSMSFEQWMQIGGFFLAAVGGREAVAAGLRWWAGYRERRAQAAEALAAREDDHEARTEAKLWERLDVVEAHARECHQALAEQHSLNLQYERANADCERRYEELRRRVDRVNADVTGRIEIAAKRVARSLTPPKPMPAVSSRADLEPEE